MDGQGEEYQLLVFKVGHITSIMVPVDVSPALGLFGCEVPDISDVRRPSGVVNFLISITYASLSSVVADNDAYREGNP